jgi:hypothetical protein
MSQFNMQNNCIDCGKEVSRNSKLGRCKSCSHKGILHSNYKDGKYIQKIFNCIKCGKSISVMASKGLCKSCSQKKENSSRKNKRPHCIDCEIEISYSYKGHVFKRCQKCMGLLRRGRNHPLFGKSVSWKRIKYNNVWIRSSWETAYAKYLDKNNVKWLYESKTFDLGDTTYTPDFYLPETDRYIEIKGWERKDFRKKIELLKIKYSDIKIIILKKKELKTLKILL